MFQNIVPFYVNGFPILLHLSENPVSIYFFKVVNGNTTNQNNVWNLPKFKNIDVVLVDLLLTSWKFHTLSWCFHCRLWTIKRQVEILKNIAHWY